MDTGVAHKQLDLEEYGDALDRRLDSSQHVFQEIIHRAKSDPRRIVFPEGEEEKILRAAEILHEEKIAQPILLGNRETIQKAAEKFQVSLSGCAIVDPASFGELNAYAEEYYQLRQRKGCTRVEAREPELAK